MLVKCLNLVCLHYNFSWNALRLHKRFHDRSCQKLVVNLKIDICQLRNSYNWEAPTFDLQRATDKTMVHGWSTRTGLVHLEHHSSKRCCLSFDDCGRESCLTWQTKIAMCVWVEIWELWRPYSIICIVFMFIKPFRKPLWMGTLPSWKRINNDQSELILHWHFLLSGRVTTNHVHKTSPKAQQSHWTYAL